MTALGIPPAVIRGASRVAEKFRSSTGVYVDAFEILTGRAGLLGIAPRGLVSAGGATRLLRAVDGWCAITLSRRDDVDAVPALVQADATPADPWLMVRRWAAGSSVASVVERARLLEIPVAALGEAKATHPRVLPLGRSGVPRRASGLLVADLTSMWAGPLCGQLLLRAGAVVVKVESPSRPDGTRAGSRAFFDWMNAGKLSYAIDFAHDTEKLHALLSAADVVIEGSRPSALSGRGLGPRDVTGPPGRTWLRISGHGTRDDGWRPAFGDDAAVAGGLVRWSANEPAFCGDAIADPLTGLTAALSAIESLARGGGELIEIAMAEVAASYAALPHIEDGLDRPLPIPLPHAPAHELGADNAGVAVLLAGRAGRTC